jgi:SAM-dependent methyltransferase
MGDDWFNIANLTHFWMRRRSEVMQKLAADAIKNAHQIAEIGCGHGVLQRQIEDLYGREVAGFDLHESSLQHSVSRTSPLYCYDIFQRNLDLKARFDLIVLFDVIEHIDDEDAFLKAVQFHLTPNGRILVNVPALQSLYSDYDVVVGHVRRYSLSSLARLAERNGMRVKNSTYWGFALLPLLAIRKLWMKMQSRKSVISAGFDAHGAAMNNLLLHLSRCEIIPQRLIGTSLMMIFEKLPE